jgi:hypothetical protein
MRTRTYIAFLLVFGGLFYVLTFSNRHSMLATGWNSFTTYGWPGAWLHLHVMDTTQWVNGQRIQGQRSIKGIRVDWLPCLFSGGVCAAISIVLLTPLFIYDWKRDERNGANQKIDL